MDERFNGMQPPVPAERGEPITAEERDWVLMAVYGTWVGWTFTLPAGWTGAVTRPPRGLHTTGTIRLEPALIGG